MHIRQGIVLGLVALILSMGTLALPAIASSSAHAASVSHPLSVSQEKLNPNDQCGSSTHREAGFILYPDQFITALHSCTGPGFELIYQGDGNLVLYQVGLYGQNTVARWASWTQGTCPGYVLFQGDGNFVIYDCSGAYVWASWTQGNPDAYIVLQGDGNLVIYNSGEQAIWDTGTQI